MKYLKLIPIFLLGAMLTACNTTKKLYEAQEYDQVIQLIWWRPPITRPTKPTMSASKP